MTTELGMAVRHLLSGALEALRMNVHDNWHLRDEAIDLARDQIVERCFNMMGLQQLRDQELRWILGYQRIAQELERIADYACDVAELSELRPDRGSCGQCRTATLLCSNRAEMARSWKVGWNGQSSSYGTWRSRRS